MMAQMVRDFGDKFIRPSMMEWDESQEFPVAVFQEMGKLGLMGVLVPRIWRSWFWLFRICNSHC